MTPTIEFQRVGVSLRGRSVLSDVTFSVQPGETVGVIGPNGAGKTTLLGTLMGIRRVSVGSLMALGQNISELRGSDLARFRVRVGYVPQFDVTSPGAPLTVREVVQISRAGRAGLLRRLRPEDHAAVETWLDRMGLTTLADRPYAQLSGGQQRKVQLARALAQEPEILLMDEPASNLDLVWQETLVQLIENISSSTTITMLLVSHDLSLLPPSCDRVAVLADGRLSRIGPPREVLIPQVLSALYGTPVEVERRDGRYHVFPACGTAEDT